MKKVFAVVLFGVLLFSVAAWAGDKEDLMLEKKQRIEAQFQLQQANIAAAQSKMHALTGEFKELAEAWKAAGHNISNDGQWVVEKPKDPTKK